MLQPRCRAPPEPGHGQRIRHDVCRHLRLQRPANDVPVEQVEHNGQVKPAFLRPQVGDVRRPDLIQRRWREIPGQPIIRHRQTVPRVRRDLVAPLVAGVEAVVAHQCSTRSLLAEKPLARSSQTMRGLL